MPPALMSRRLQHQGIGNSDSGEGGRGSASVFHSVHQTCHFGLGGSV